MKRDPLQCTRIAAFRAASAGEEDDGRTLRGYAAVFDQDTVIESWEGRFKERIDGGAFKKTLRESTPIMQWNHGHDPAVGQIPIGVYKRIEPDSHGLDCEGRLHTDPVSDRVREAISSGAVTGMSFKFQVIRDEWRDSSGRIIRDKNKLYNLLYNPQEGDEMPTRTIKEVRLFEMGPVSTPAYSGTSVGVRSADELTENERQAVVARMLRVSPDDEDDEERTAQITQWLEAESRWKADIEAWLAAEDEFRKKDAEKPYGDVTYADPGYQKDGKKRYPLDTKEHVKSAWSYINQDKNAAKYTPAQVKSIKSKIKAAAKKFGVSIDPEKKSSDVDAAARSTSAPGERTDAAPAGTSERNRNNNIQKGKIMKLEELRARRAALVARQAAINEEHRDADLPDELQTEFDEATDEMREIDEKIEKIEARQRYMKGIAETGGSQVERGDQAQHREGPAVHTERNIFDLDETRKMSYSGDDYVERVKEDALRFVEKVRPSRITKVDAARERMSELLQDFDDENGTLAKRFLVTGSPIYERAFGKAVKACSKDGLLPEEARALALGGGGGTGGFAVPVQLDPTVILTSPGVIGDIRKYARVETIVGKEWQGVTSDGITVSRDAEAQEVSDDSPTLAQPTVKAEAVRGFVPFSIEIDQDWPQLRSEITRMLADAKRREEASAFAIGTGVAPNPQGVITGASTFALPATTTTAAGFRGQLPASLYDLEAALDPRWRENAVWMGNKSVFNQVRMVDTNGGANLWERIGKGMPAELIGYPVVENHAMASVYTNGTRILAFGDLSQYLIVDRVGMNVELVQHLVGANFRPTGQRGIFAMWRNGAKLLVPAAVKVFTTTT